MIAITENLAIHEYEIQESFVRSSGPGGQNVNKVATAVQLRFDLKGSLSLSEEVRERALRLGGKRVTAEGVLVIEARRYRSQEKNRQDARDRLIKLLQKASLKPKTRKRTQRSPAAIEQRLAEKKRRGTQKQLRRSVDMDE